MNIPVDATGGTSASQSPASTNKRSSARRAYISSSPISPGGVGSAGGGVINPDPSQTPSSDSLEREEEEATAGSPLRALAANVVPTAANAALLQTQTAGADGKFF